MAGIRAVVFDIGGVIQDSPLHAIARYETEHGLPAGSINRAVVATGETGAWSRLERGELTVEAWCVPFERDCHEHGVTVDGARLMRYIADAGRERPIMLRGRLRVEPAETAFLDDIGTNLKSARALGMHTIKVDDPAQALRELGALVGLDLL